MRSTENIVVAQTIHEIYLLIQVNGHDVHEATTDETVRAISSAAEPVIVEVLRRPTVSGRRPPPPTTTTGGMMDSDVGSPTDCLPPVTMVTTATQTDDCALDDDDDEVGFVDQFDCYPLSGSCQQYAFCDHL